MRLGLPKGSAQILVALGKSGGMHMGELVRKAKVHRPAAYRSVRALSTLGIVFTTNAVGKRALIRSKGVHSLVQAFAEVAEMVRDVRDNKNTHATPSTIHHLSGPAGIATVFEDVTTHTARGDTFYRYTSECDLDEVNSFLPKKYRTLRDNKRLERQVISNPESGKRKRPRLERFVKFLEGEREQFRQNAIQLVYGSRIAFIDLNTQDCIIIENDTLASFQRVIFRALYRRL